MAESAAHLTTTLDARPSIFEIVAQESLNSTVNPAIRKLVEFVVSRNPAKLGWLEDWYDETFLVFNGLLQGLYLTYHDASFSERFYSLRRANINGDTFSSFDKKISFVSLVVWPYLRDKLEDKVQLYRLQKADGMIQNDFKGKLKRFACHTHAWVHVAVGLLTIRQYLSYMVGSSQSQTLLLRAISLQLTYAQPEEDGGFWSALFKGSLSFSTITSQLLTRGMTTLLEVVAFFMQFLQTWNADVRNVSLTALPVTDPPPYDEDVERKIQKCPLCMQEWKIPTVVPVSGYVFCFRCITRHLQEHQRCPVTHLPASVSGLIRLYEA